MEALSHGQFVLGKEQSMRCWMHHHALVLKSGQYVSGNVFVVERDDVALPGKGENRGHVRVVTDGRGGQLGGGVVAFSEH